MTVMAFLPTIRTGWLRRRRNDHRRRVVFRMEKNPKSQIRTAKEIHVPWEIDGNIFLYETLLLWLSSTLLLYTHLYCCTDTLFTLFRPSKDIFLKTDASTIVAVWICDKELQHIDNIGEKYRPICTVYTFTRCFWSVFRHFFYINESLRDSYS